jgi:hypothetical protein
MKSEFFETYIREI